MAGARHVLPPRIAAAFRAKCSATNGTGAARPAAADRGASRPESLACAAARGVTCGCSRGTEKNVLMPQGTGTERDVLVPLGYRYQEMR
ncbi:hypothetical protein NDU88_000230 [Pleurodeles waltl]|uniref:Uncharacterized protein n=1 Tax=Pleurodeles waltl TaxID=8319 RepID=A0AAV7NFH3_PLEWA|nr:hypothetical protein NDU88_000230 [Pleurodeles waltl]